MILKKRYDEKRITSKRYSLVRTAEPPRPATIIATLRCETVTERVRHRLTDALPAIKGKAVTVSSQLFRSLRLLHNCQLTVLVYALPASHREENNRPGADYQRYRQCPESAYINIIPSGLCNSSQDRHHPLERHQYSKGHCPATTSCRLRVSTIRIMLSTLCQ